MNWTKPIEVIQRLLFLVLWMTFSLLFLFLSFKGWVWQEELKQEIQFKKILKERESISSRLQKNLHINSKLANDNYRYNFVKRLLQSHANQVREHLLELREPLQSNRKAWQKLMSDVEVPFQTELHVSIAQNRQIVFQSGPKLQEIFGKNWNKDLLRLQYDILKTKNTEIPPITNTKLLKLSKNIFSLPMEASEYADSLGKCQLIFHFRSKSYVYFYNLRFSIADQKIDLVMAVLANSLTHDTLLQALQYDLISRYMSSLLKTSEVDQMQLSNQNFKAIFMDKDQARQINSKGLTYYPSYTEFRPYCEQHFILLMLLLIFGLILTYLGGFQAFKYNFEWTLLLIFLFSMSLSYLLIDQFFFEAREQKRAALLMDTKKLIKNALKNLESSLQDHSEKLAEEAIRVTKNPDSIRTSDLPSGTVMLKITSDYTSQLSSKTTTSKLQVGMLKTGALTILTMQREWNPDLTDIQFQTISTDRRKLKDLLQKNKKLYKLSSQDYDIFDLNPDSYLVFIQHNRTFYGSDFAEKFSRVPVFSQGYYFFWRKSFNATNNLNELYLIGIPGPDYLKSFLATERYFKTDLDQPIKWFIKEENVQTASVNQLQIATLTAARIIDRGRSQINDLVDFRIADKDYLLQYLNSDIIPDYEFLVLVDKQRVMQPYNQLNIAYKRFIPFYFLVGIVIGLLLSRQILNPISKLQSGFDQLQEENYKIKLESRSRDESRKLLEQFNQMVDELHQRNAMRPFVSDAVTHLFKIMSDGQDYIESNGAVILCDIRSFTTISETYTAEEIVQMLNEYFTLWQNIVEKHDGIIDRFIGDAISVVFLEELHEDYIQRAIRTSIEVMHSMPRFNQNRQKDGKFTIKNGIGIAQSKVTFAVVGTEEKQEFFIYGDAPDLAEKLEAESKKGSHSHIIVDSNVYNAEKTFCKYESFEACAAEYGQCYEIVMDNSESEVTT